MSVIFKGKPVKKLTICLFPDMIIERKSRVIAIIIESFVQIQKMHMHFGTFGEIPTRICPHCNQDERHQSHWVTGKGWQVGLNCETGYRYLHNKDGASGGT